MMAILRMKESKQSHCSTVVFYSVTDRKLLEKNELNKHNSSHLCNVINQKQNLISLVNLILLCQDFSSNIGFYGRMDINQLIFRTVNLVKFKMMNFEHELVNLNLCGLNFEQTLVKSELAQHCVVVLVSGIYSGNNVNLL